MKLSDPQNRLHIQPKATCILLGLLLIGSGLWLLRNTMQIDSIYYPDQVITSPVSQMSEAFPLLLKPSNDICAIKAKPLIRDRIITANRIFTNAIAPYDKTYAVLAMEFIMEEMVNNEHVRSEFTQAAWIYADVVTKSDKVSVEEVEKAAKDVFKYALKLFRAFKSTKHKLSHPQDYLQLIDGKNQIQAAEWRHLFKILFKTAREYGLSKAKEIEFFKYYDNEKYIQNDIHSINLDNMISFALLKEDLQSFDLNQYNKVPQKLINGYPSSTGSQTEGFPISPFLFTPEEQEDDDVFILLAVLTAPKEFQRRHMIRNTWGRTRVINGKRIRTIFFMGIDQSGIVQVRVEKEAQVFKDIVQHAFPDIYSLLVHKTVTLFDWVSQTCNTAKWVVKIDSDVLLRPEKMVELLEKLNPTRTAIGVKVEGMPPLRDPTQRNYEPFELFSGDKYPPYLSGPCYAISGDLIYELVQTMIHLPWLRNEDAFTGVCLNRMGVSLINTYPKQDSWVLEFTPRCDLLNNYISAHTIRNEKIKSLWSEFASGYIGKMCSA